MSTQKEATESLGNRIMEFIRDTVSLDVLTLTGTITLKSAANAAFDNAVTEAASNLDKAKANKDAADAGGDPEKTKTAAEAFAKATVCDAEAKEAVKAREARDKAAKAVEDQKTTTATKDKLASEAEAKAKKAEEEHAADAQALRTVATNTRSSANIEKGKIASMIDALKTEEDKFTAAKAVLAPQAFNWDTLVAQITSQMEASSENAIRVVAYTHAEWDCDATHFIAKPTDEFEKTLIANHATMVDAAHRSRFEALKAIGAAIKSLIPA